MESEQPQSPFVPGFEGVSSAESQTPPAPDPYQGGEPRLGIIHLLVWTACVAMVLGSDQTFSAVFSHGQDKSGVILARGLAALGSGAGLGGLFLWGWRRRHGRPFPRHPGEYLLVVIGLSAILSMLMEGVLCALVVPVKEAIPSTSWLLPVWTCSDALACGAMYSVAAWCVTAWRWKAAFLVCLTVTILRTLISLLDAYSSVSWLVVSLPTDLAILIAILIDLRHRLRFPWPHWLGIVIFYWDTIVSLVWMLLRLN